MFSLIPFLFAALPACWAYPASNNSNETNLCGLAKPHADNGYNASYPWAVSIHIPDGLHCSGSIIGPRHILTAAHCTFMWIDSLSPPISLDAKYLTIIAGVSDYNSPDSVKFEVESYVRQSKFDWNGPYDVAVLTLKKPIEFSERMSPICLDSIGAEVGAIAVAAGWGSVKSSDCYEGESTHQLHQGQMRIVNRDECNLETFRLPFIPKLEVCAKGVNAVAGKGDSGGMLMVERDHLWYQIGINSYLGGCKVPPRNISDVFTSVAHFREWILNEVNK